MYTYCIQEIHSHAGYNRMGCKNNNLDTSVTLCKQYWVVTGQEFDIIIGYSSVKSVQCQVGKVMELRCSEPAWMFSSFQIESCCE